MSEVAETYGVMRQASQAKRAMNRDNAQAILTAAKVEFKVYSLGGTHLGVYHGLEIIDFWPGTGLWRTKNLVHGRGILALLKHMGKAPDGGT